MNFKQLEAFYWLAKLGSYQEVAKQINITQSAVSIRIGSLESELGAQLIRRDLSQFELTEKGHEVAAFAGEFMRLHEHMRHSLMNEKSRPIVIGMIEPIMSSWGGEFIRIARIRYGDIGFNLRMAHNQDLLKSIEQGEIDLVFGSTTAGTAPTSWRVRYRLSWVAHTRFPIPASEPLTTADLAKLPLILYMRTLSAKSPLAGTLSAIRALEHREITVLSLSAMCELVRNGLGIAPVVLASLVRDLETGDLRKIETIDPLPTVDACCLFINPGRRNERLKELYCLAGKIAQDWCEQYPKYARFIPE